MNRLTLLRTGLGLPVCLTLTQGAFADVTAVQVFEDWKEYLQSTGYTISATEVVEGGTVTVNDLKLTVPLEDGAPPLMMETGPLTFVQDGADVRIVMPAEMPLNLSTAPNSAGADPWAMRFLLKQSGHSNVVSGVPEQMTYTTAVETLELNLVELVTDGDSFGADNARINMSASDLRSKTVMTVDAVRNYAQTGGVAKLDYDIFLHNPKEDVKLTFKGETSDVRFDGLTDVPNSVADSADMSAMLAAGFSLAGSFSYGAGNMQFDVQQPSDGTIAASTSSDGGRLAVNMGSTALGYEVEQNNLQMVISSGDLPFPVNFSMAQAGLNLAMPIAQSDEAQDFAFGINLSEFVMADLLWSIFDPSGQLPRDPASVQLDLSGTAKMLIDLMDTAAVTGASSQLGALETLQIEKLLLDAVGAKVEGTGDFTFDNADQTTYPGMPKPVGAVNIAISGANALMDKLVAMGLLPEQQAMGARMMMGLFAVPGDAPDTLKSTVEFNEAGQILANGQRIK